MKRTTKTRLVVLVAFIFAVTVITIKTNNLSFPSQEEPTIQEVMEPSDKLKQKAIEEIKKETEFEQKADEEAEIWYYKRQMEEARKRLQELDGAGFSSNKQKAEILSQYLKSKGAHELAQHTREIVELPRWIDVIAIIGKETSFCQAGVGNSRNNCGAIRSTKNGGEFKIYENIYDSVWDVAYLLEKPHFKGKSIAEMNGTYCVYEEMGGGKCPGWTEQIEKTANEITQIAYTHLY